MLTQSSASRSAACLLLISTMAACNSSSSGAPPIVAPPALTTLQFESRTDVPVGAVATSVAAGDIDGDNRADLVVTRFQESKVTYLRSQGNGTFAPGIDLPIGPLSPVNLTLADLDNDGWLDVIVGDFGNDLVFAYRNTGGAFAPPVSFATGSGPLSFTVADFDGDGAADIAVACTISREIVVHRGLGAFAFAPGIPFVVNGFPITIVSGDYDGDGRVDVAVTDIATASLWIYKNVPEVVNGFALTAQAVGSTGTLVVGLAQADLDGAAGVEFVTSSADTNAVLVWKFNGTTLTPMVQVIGPAPTGGLALADFDGDGKADLAAAHGDSSGASVWRGLGNLQFTAPVTRASGLTPVFIAAADTSGDGLADLHLACSDSGQVSCYFGQAGGSGLDPVTGPPAVYGGPAPLLLGAGDLNGDARPDLVVGDNLGNNFNILRNDGDLGFTKVAAIAVPANNSYQAVLLDIDKDGDLDIAALHSAGVTLYRNQGNFVFQEIKSINVQGGLLLGVAADLFVNGRPEFAATSFGGNRVAVFKNLNGDISLLYNMPAGANPAGIDVADMDNDGDLDIIHANLGSNTVAITTRSRGTFAPNAVQLLTSAEPVYVRAADFNSDGRKDLAVSHRSAFEILQIRAVGKLEYGSPIVTQTNGDPMAMVVADVDRNGVADVLYTETQTGRATLRLTQTGGNFGAPATTFASQYNVTTPFYVDLDGDQLPEFLTTSAYTSFLEIHKNKSQ